MKKEYFAKYYKATALAVFAAALFFFFFYLFFFPRHYGGVVCDHSSPTYCRRRFYSYVVKVLTLKPCFCLCDPDA